MDIKAIFKAEAENLGFALTGITTPSPPTSFSKFEAWLNAGFHAEMGYLQREDTLLARRDPTILFPDCKSIIVLAMPYPSPAPASMQTSSLTTAPAAYARFRDYHQIIPTLIEQLMAQVQSITGIIIDWRAFTDSAPILEHDLARRAGLGWIGRNALLIHPRFGSCFFLAEIFIDLELTADVDLIPDRCGTCRRCVEACPTQCIQDNRTIDARKCLSYLTIEHKGVIPESLRPAFGPDHLFGCDLCQQVCPWNQKPQTTPISTPFSPIDTLTKVDLVNDLTLTEQEFKTRYEHTPIIRAKRRGYVRNLCVLLGNRKDQRAVPSLTKLLEEETEPIIRVHAAWALFQIIRHEADPLFERILDQESDSVVREEIQSLLKQA
ncbi:MAG: tRNA epoxyqueuosine(34) reductase QueG [Anaerolineaceae bacterium]|nr:tRNA epoxyqueuosine(34) reductase QueG [Anaerolineaceae bacterium]